MIVCAGKKHYVLLVQQGEFSSWTWIQLVEKRNKDQLSSMETSLFEVFKTVLMLAVQSYNKLHIQDLSSFILIHLIVQFWHNLHFQDVTLNLSLYT